MTETTKSSPDIEPNDTTTPVAADRAIASASASNAAPARQPTPVPVLPLAQRLNIAASHLDYAIMRGKDDERAILKDVPLVVPAGKLTVILGASGAGKTSLLNVVAGETKKGKITGAMYQNGQPTTGSDVKKVSGYGISGGERKRLMIAMELVTSGACIFLEEPTSGLDSYTAYSPSSEFFHLIDNLVLLASGEVMFAGSSELSIEYFARQDPCDYYIMSILNTTGTAASTTRRKPPAEETAAAEARIAPLLQSWKELPEHAAIMAEIASPSRTDGITIESFKSMSRFFDQFLVLFPRAGRNAIRN
ncbi:hypothetical protein AMAG_03683 [Allomyces macrogynus ATCC 38327]|uniref:AAA+ ATPase domain-containing protein n=1 Tax=Allomyces macrogynus (strain ATCC 38327) TaxID=578462 RepID=A0A0L0SAG9_ALLM3|nr:hypothetical protein AMAG_03683 [Allomyces macrogynus ATCC 38327]|eukprot:KNE59400.1 hypothetical protein AMAG_03683 [Allomyces macrogynus ATCC 38327]